MSFNYEFKLPEIVDLEQLKLQLDTGWPWPLSAVQGFFEDVVNKIVGIASKVWDLIPSWIKDPIQKLPNFLNALTSYFLDFMKDPLGKIKSILGYVWDIAPDFIKKPIAALSNFLGQLTTATMDFLKDPIGKIKAVLSYVWDIMPAAIKDSLKAVANFAAGISAAFLDFMRDPIGKIKGALEYLWSITPDFIKAPLAAIGAVQNAIINFFKDPIGSLKGLASYVWNLLPDWIRGILTGLGQFLGSISAAFLDFLRDPVGKIAGALSWVIDKLSPVVDQITKAAQQVYETAAQPIANIAAGINEILSEKAVAWFDGAVAGLAAGIEQYVFKPVGDLLNKYVVEPITKLPEMIINFLGVAGSTLGAIINEKVIPAISGALSWVIENVKNLFRNFYNGIKNFIENTAKTTPENWPEAVAELAMISVGLGLTLSVAQTKILACGLDLGPISDILNKITDPGLLLNPVISGLMGAGFGVALQRYLNKKYMNWLPSPSDAYKMMAQGIISYDEAKDIASNYGISANWFNRLVDLWDFNPGISDLYSWATYVEISTDIIDEVMKINRIPARWKPIMREVIRLRPLRNEIGSLISRLVDLRDSGYITSSEFSSKLNDMQKAGYIKATEVAIREDQAELGFNKTILALRIDTLKYLFRKGKIDADTLEAQLKELGVDPLLANAIKENELARAGLLEVGG